MLMPRLLALMLQTGPGDGLRLPFVPGQWEDWGIKTCIWMGLASVAVLAPMFEQTLAIEIE